MSRGSNASAEALERRRNLRASVKISPAHRDKLREAAKARGITASALLEEILAGVPWVH